MEKLTLYYKKVDLLLTLTLLIIGAGIILTSMTFSLNQSYIGYSIIIPCLFYFLLRHKFSSNCNDFNKTNELYSQRIFFLLLCLFFIILVTSFYLLTFESHVYNRSPIYFIAISFACIIIANQIFFFSHEKNYNTYLLLFEIFLVSLSIRWSIYYLFPGIIGVDSWYHIGLIQEIINFGHLSNTTEYVAYSKIPSMHILVVIFKLITEMSLKDSYFILCIVEIISTVFVFFIAKNVFNLRLALLSTLILNISDQFIYWGVQITPMTLGVAFYMIIFSFIYYFFKRLESKMATLTFICLIFLALMILTHSIPTFITAVTMFSLLLVIKLLQVSKYKDAEIALSKISLNSNLFITFSICVLAYWIFIFRAETDSSFFTMALFSIKRALFSADFGNVELVTQISKSNSWNTAINHIGYSLLISFYVLSIILLTKKRYIYGLILATIPAFLLGWIYIPSLIGSNATLPHRWFLFLYPLISVFAAFGIFSFIEIFGLDKSQKIFILSSIFFIFVFFMITNSTSNNDSPVYPSDLLDDFSYSRSCYYESEMAAASFTKQHYVGMIVLDRRYASVLKYWYGLDYISFLSLSNPPSNIDGMVLLRKCVINGYISDYTTSYMFIYQRPTEEFIRQFKSKDYLSVYENGEVKGLINKNH